MNSRGDNRNDDYLEEYERAELEALDVIGNYDRELSAYKGKIETSTRSNLATIILYLFSAVIILTTLATILTIFPSFLAWSEWKEPAEFLLKMLSSVLLPVVTLVIGYFFGKEK